MAEGKCQIAEENEVLGSSLFTFLQRVKTVKFDFLSLYSHLDFFELFFIPCSLNVLYFVMRWHHTLSGTNKLHPIFYMLKIGCLDNSLLSEED